ncbi:Leukocyte receptor cluster member 1 [Apophysomyces sp. BC1015]|nr:Leukocyte receptor cluster member 1 [Apophysomyces sp. BC1015]
MAGRNWHVYNIKNIEKVKKDEAKAKQEEVAKSERATVAESEARLNLLRQRAQARQQSNGAVVESSASTTVQHVNLFDLEKNAQNEEYVAEQKEKDDKLNRQVTMYLNKTEETEGTPWYAARDDDEKYKDVYVKRYKPKEGSSKRKRPAITLKDDPLEVIRGHLDKQEKKKHKHSPHKEKRKQNSSHSSSSSIEALRAQRLERERGERSRTRSVVFGESPQPAREQTQRYNSQFNPKETASTKMRFRRRQYE